MSSTIKAENIADRIVHSDAPAKEIQSIINDEQREGEGLNPNTNVSRSGKADAAQQVASKINSEEMKAGHDTGKGSIAAVAQEIADKTAHTTGNIQN